MLANDVTTKVPKFPAFKAAAWALFVLLVLLAYYVFYETRNKHLRTLPPGTYGNATCPIVSIQVVGDDGAIGRDGTTTACAASTDGLLYTCGSLAGSNHSCPQLTPTGLGEQCVDGQTTRACFGSGGLLKNVSSVTTPAFTGLTNSSTLTLSNNATSFEMPNVYSGGWVGGPGVFWRAYPDPQGRIIFAANETARGLTTDTPFDGDIYGTNATLFLKSRGFGANFTVGSANCNPILKIADAGFIETATQACTAFVNFGNNTVLLGDPNGIIITDFGNNTFQISPSQPIWTGATPTWAGLRINNYFKFVANGGSPPPSYLGGVNGALSLSGSPATDVVNTFGASGALNTPALYFYMSDSSYPRLGMQSRTADDGGLFWDMYPSFGTAIFPNTGLRFNWIGDKAGVQGYSLWKSSNQVLFLAAPAPASAGDEVVPITLTALSSSAYSVYVPTTIYSDATITGNAQVQGVFTLPNTALYVNSGGTGSATSLVGHKFAISVAGTNGGSWVESTTGSLRYEGTFTMSCGSYSHSASFALARIGDVIAVRIGTAFSFNPASICFLSGSITGVPTGLDVSQAHCVQTRGQLNLLDGTISGCIQGGVPGTIDVNGYFGDWGDFTPGTNYFMPPAFDFVIVAYTTFT